jgi:hypothetical protein
VCLPNLTSDRSCFLTIDPTSTRIGKALATEFQNDTPISQRFVIGLGFLGHAWLATETERLLSKMDKTSSIIRKTSPIRVGFGEARMIFWSKFIFRS